MLPMHFTGLRRFVLSLGLMVQNCLVFNTYGSGATETAQCASWEFVGTSSVEQVGTAPSAFYLLWSLSLCIVLFSVLIFYFKNR